MLAFENGVQRIDDVGGRFSKRAVEIEDEKRVWHARDIDALHRPGKGSPDKGRELPGGLHRAAGSFL